ncbi:hypothetical protein EDD16DRAFT_1770317 [Pisolithus croceorrhizus]|nr:hypothetical protein EDD16DRAFT_1770317 [Pisolithus croceorrhizus]KAI6140375.1 hypothetical protein EDD17DRAFT_1802979 [Pisolithus thermaeus]
MTGGEPTKMVNQRSWQIDKDDESTMYWFISTPILTEHSLPELVATMGLNRVVHFKFFASLFRLDKDDYEIMTAIMMDMPKPQPSTMTYPTNMMSLTDAQLHQTITQLSNMANMQCQHYQPPHCEWTGGTYLENIHTWSTSTMPRGSTSGGGHTKTVPVTLASVPTAPAFATLPMLYAHHPIHMPGSVMGIDELADAGALDLDDSDFVASGGTRTAVRQSRAVERGCAFNARDDWQYGGSGRDNGKGGIESKLFWDDPPSKFIKARPVGPTAYEYP